jgi:hypothetical protein
VKATDFEDSLLGLIGRVRPTVQGFRASTALTGEFEGWTLCN